MTTKTSFLESISIHIEDLYFMSRSLGDDSELRKFSVIKKDLKEMEKISKKLLEEIEITLNEMEE